MLSFYEMTTLLDKRREKLNEALSNSLRDKAKALAQRVQQQKAGTAVTADVKPPVQEPAAPASDISALTQMDEPAPGADAGAPEAQTPAAAPRRSGRKGARRRVDTTRAGGESTPARVTQTPDVNDPTAVGHRLKSREMDSVPTDDRRAANMARLMDKMHSHNEFMSKWPTLRYLTLIALKKAGYKGIADAQKNPTAPFVLAHKKGGSGQTDVREIVIADPRKLREVLNFTRSYLGGGGREERLQSKSWLQSIVSLAVNDASKFPLVERAVDMQNHLTDPDIVNKPMTIEKLAQFLSAKETGGLKRPDPSVDMQAVVHLIKTAQEQNFPYFELKPGADLTNPQTVVTVKPVGEAGFKDPLASNRTMTSAMGPDQLAAVKDDAQREKLAALRARRKGTPPAPATEAMEWMDLHMLVEHWGF